MLTNTIVEIRSTPLTTTPRRLQDYVMNAQVGAVMHITNPAYIIIVYYTKYNTTVKKQLIMTSFSGISHLLQVCKWVATNYVGIK